ncbi:hypothetical protein Q1695_008254 [Nippostrongylus brasiliensis]|nr:hypothetical protein Q1695_008254 [Nippostrongylus brasiliensis]
MTAECLKGNIVDGFWAWHDLRSFLIALTVFTAFWSIMTVILIRISIDIFILGQVFVYRKNTEGSELPYSSSSPTHSVID